MQIKVKIDNVYDDGTISETTWIKVPAPPNHDFDSEEHDDWAYDHLFPLTGTGRTEGDAGYFVEVLAAMDPALVGHTYEWGI